MQGDDVLGDEGRKALNACVKVKIYGKPETRRYDRETSLQRLNRCYAGWKTWKFRDERDDVLPSDERGRFESSYDIIDIHDARVNLDKKKCVEKYPKVGPESGKQRDLIDKRRDDVERELQGANANRDGRLRYSWLVAQRRVRDCFAGNFAEDRGILSSKPNDAYDIMDICNAFVRRDKMREKSEAKRAALEQEYVKAKTAGNGNGTILKYSRDDALDLLRNCCPLLQVGRDDISPIKLQWNQNGILVPETTKNYDIFDIHKVLLRFDGKNFEKYAKEGPGSDELRKLIDEHRADLEEEYRKATSYEVSNQSLSEYTRTEAECRVRDSLAGTFPSEATGDISLPGCIYTRSEAEHRVRDCFAGIDPSDTEIIPKKEEDESDQTYDIFDIKTAIDHFDTKTLSDAFKYASNGRPACVKINQEVDQERASIQEEYDEAIRNIEVEHGSGFIVHNHFIITNKHVIETYLNETERHEYKICISNAGIDDLPCEVAHYDAGKDLALLYCPDLNLGQCEICPLQLSNQSLLPGMSVFTFGYPMSHTDKTALFVSGNVSGSRRKYGSPSMIVLNCSLNSGNSGGPVLRWVKGQLRVLGVATQKHFKEILTFEERQTIEDIRESMQTQAIPDMPDFFKINKLSVSYYMNPRTRQTPMALLTLKLYDALETHSQFNLSNALPGNLLVEFIGTSIREYVGEHKKELVEVVELAKDL